MVVPVERAGRGGEPAGTDGLDQGPRFGQSGETELRGERAANAAAALAGIPAHLSGAAVSQRRGTESSDRTVQASGLRRFEEVARIGLSGLRADEERPRPEAFPRVPGVSTVPEAPQPCGARSRSAGPQGSQARDDPAAGSEVRGAKSEVYGL